MKNLINFFFSFDKLMKHKLVPLFFWAALIYGGIRFLREILGWTFLTEWIAKLTYVLEVSALAIMGFVGLRLICELAIAIFRIADNTSSDGGVSDLADIDPLEETRRAAEEAAKRAREATGKAVDKTKSAASNLKESAEKRLDKAGDSSPKAKSKGVDTDQVFDKPAADAVPDAPAPKPASKPAAKKPAAKKPATKTTTAKKKTATKSTTSKTTAAKKKTTTKSKPKT